MPDPKEWISRIKGVDPPELWGDVQRRAVGTPARSVDQPRPRRMAAAITGIAVGVLAFLVALQAFDQSPRTESPPSPAPKTNGMVAFLRTDPRSTIREGGDPRTALFVVGPDGRGVQRLIPRVDHYDPPAWSPDGRQIAFVRDGDLYTIDVEDREESLLVACEPPACERFGPVAWSPRGTRIAFGKQGPVGNELWVSNADGTGARLLRDRIFIDVPTWSPDERFLAVSGYVGEAGDHQNEGIFVIDAETGVLVLTIPLAGLDSGFTVGWSPDGEWLVFDAIGEGGVDYGIPTAEAGAGIYLIRPDGTDRRLLTSVTCESNVCLDLNPSWSPDGREIVFTRSLPEPGSDGSLGDLFVIDVESGDVRHLTSGPGLDCCASWQPLPAGTTKEEDPASAQCPAAPYTVSRLPWLEAGSEISAPELVTEGKASLLVWFEDPVERWNGRHVALTRSTHPLISGSLTEFPTVSVRGQLGHLIWVGDPGVGGLSIVWTEPSAEPCAWYSLTLLSQGMSEGQAETEIRRIAASLEDAPTE